jgi:hypothetical protein
MVKTLLKTIVAAVLAVTIPLGSPVIAPNPYAGGAYTDIADMWFEEAATEYGYTDIFSDGSGRFNPDNAITRMEFARLLHRALGININYFAPVDISEHFTDVKNDDLGASELYDLVTAGIVQPGGSFEPDGTLSREEMVLLVLKALDCETGGEYAVILIMPAPFTDDDEITEAHKSDIYKAVVLGLIKGHEDYSLRPKEATTRAEAVTVISRLVKIIDNLTQRVDVSASMAEENGGLKMTLSIENRTKKAVTINHTSGQKFDFKLFDGEGNNLYTWSADKAFTMALTSTEIEAGESVEFEAFLVSEQYGTLKDKLASMRAYIVGTSEDFYIDPEGYEALK